MTKRDDNFISPTLATEDDSSRDAVPLKIDPVTRRLLITIVGNPASGSVHTQPLPRDENRVPVAGGVSDDANRNVVPFHIDSSENVLALDVVYE